MLSFVDNDDDMCHLRDMITMYVSHVLETSWIDYLLGKKHYFSLLYLNKF